MPNWIDGTFRAQGKKEDIIRFVNEGLQPCSGDKTEDPWGLSYEDEKYIEFDCKCATVWVANTKRQFLDVDYALICQKVSETNPSDWRIVARFSGAWCIDTDGLKEVSREYNLRIKANGFEQGLRFSQTAEFYNGETLFDDIEKYADWDWDCPMPLVGG